MRVSQLMSQTVTLGIEIKPLEALSWISWVPRDSKRLRTRKETTCEAIDYYCNRQARLTDIR
jgi:hypothetical protein